MGDLHDNIKVTVAVNGYKNTEMLKVCLSSLQKYTDPKTMEIVVADSATEHATELMMEEDFPDITFLPHKKNVGFGKMINACITHAHGEYVFFLNADTIVESETISELLKFMETYSDVGMCGPMQKNFNGQWENTRFRFYEIQTIVYRRTFLRRFGFAQKHLEHFEMQDVDSQEPHPVAWVIGSAMFVRKKAIDDIGGMDPRFFMYMEDVDWCRRFWQAGWKVFYHPHISIYHFYGKGSAKKGLQGLFLNSLTRIHLASGIKYFLKYRKQKMPHIS